MEEEMYGCLDPNTLMVGPRQYESLVADLPSAHMQSRGVDIVSSPYVEDNRAYMLSGTHEDGVTIIFDEAVSDPIGAVVRSTVSREEASNLGYDGLNAELAETEMRREATRQRRIAREAQARQVELDRRNQFGPLPNRDPLYTAMTDGTYTIQSGREVPLRAGDAISQDGRIEPRTGWTIHGNTSGFEAGDQLNVRSADGRTGISRVVSVDNNLFNIDPISYDMWRGREVHANGTLSPELIQRAVARGLEGFGRVDTPDIWNREYDASFTLGGNVYPQGFDPFGEAAEGSVENPYKLEFGTGQLIARKEGWYAFSHLPEWIVELETGIVEFDDNDFPKYVLDRKRIS